MLTLEIVACKLLLLERFTISQLKVDHHSYRRNFAVAKRKPEKMYGLYGIRKFESIAAMITVIIPLHEKFLQFDWLRAVVFQLNLKYLHVKITNLLRVVVV